MPRRRRCRGRARRAATGWSGSIRRSQLRTTSDGRSGLPSENVRSGRRWNVTCRPSSLKRHDLARAGRTCRSASKLVSDSNSWAVIAALPASPWAAGSSVVGLPDRIRTGRSGPAAVDPPHEANSVAATRRTNRRRIAGSIGRVTGCPPPGDRAPARRSVSAGSAAFDGHGMRPRKSTPPGERWDWTREASGGITSPGAETLGLGRSSDEIGPRGPG